MGLLAQLGLVESDEEKALRLAQEQQQRIQGLLGSEAQPAQTGMLGRFTMPLTPAKEGTGYLGSDRGLEAQTNLLAQAQGAGYTPQQAMGLLQPTQTAQAEQGTNQRFLLGKQIESQNLEKVRVGDFANQKDRLAAVRGIGSDFRKEVAPFKQSIQYYNDSASLAQKRGGVDKMTGTDDFIIMRNLLKQSLPNESVMGDDLDNIRLASGGVPGWASALIAQLTGGGYQGIQARREILTTMRDMAETRSVERDAIRDQYTQLSGGIEGVNTQDFMRDPLTVSPLPLDGRLDPGKYTQAEIQAELKRRQMSGSIKR